MTPAAYQPFFTASVAASAALTGLLFVSVSIAPERVFGKEAESGRQAQALSAFTALANVFFISFGGLMPDVPLGVIVTIVAIPAVLQNLALLGLVTHWRGGTAAFPCFFLLPPRPAPLPRRPGLPGPPLALSPAPGGPSTP